MTDGQEREALEAFVPQDPPPGMNAHAADFLAGYRAALAAREEARPGTQCGHAGPDGAICKLPLGHDRLHLQRLERGYVEWER